ncbi:MAG: hypothetical protein ACK4NY_17995, partial [Spirosomataceae bacterium]
FAVFTAIKVGQEYQNATFNVENLVNLIFENSSNPKKDDGLGLEFELIGNKYTNLYALSEVGQGIFFKLR